MVEYKFSSELLLWMEKKELSRKDFIDFLQDSIPNEFEGLDLVTLSRWLTDKSTPPLYKQIYIAVILNADILDIIIRINISKFKKSNKCDLVVSLLSKALDFSTSVLSYKKLTGNIRSEIRNISHLEYFNFFYDFNKNVSALNSFKNELYNIGNEIEYTVIFLKNENDEIIGHWSGISCLKKLSSFTSFIKVPDSEIKNSCLIMLGYYSGANNYFELITQAICYFIIKYNNSKRYAYFFIPDFKPMLDFIKVMFNAKCIKYYRGEKNEIGIHLIKLDIIKSICNPIILTDVQKKLRCLSNCKPHCNLCNLKEFRN
ncbi:XRE family transcriptional regulator [Shewanella sp. A25]|nr:XRE family transcriptional regulator [Shewanella shenzhenensis]